MKEEAFGKRIRYEPMVFRAFRRKLERSEAKWKIVGSNPTLALFTKPPNPPKLRET
jgi:hypothetical protein